MAASLPRTTPIKILYTLWALLTAALVLDTADDLASLANLAPRPYQEPAPLQLPPNYNPFLAEQLRQQRLSREQERFRQDQFAAMQDVGPLAFHFVCNLWALLGSVGLAAVRFNWGRWSVRRRVLYGGFALAFVLGRPLVGWLSIVMTLIPPGSILGWLVLVAAPPTLLWLAGLLQIILIAALIGAVFAVLVGVPATLFNQILQFEIAAQVFRHKQAGLVGYIVRFGYWLSGEVMPEIPDDTRGARLATPEEATAKNDPRGLSYGWMSGLPLYLYTEKHILIQASTRSGKGTAIILPHLLHYRGSIFCIDPKGENAKASGRFRELVNDKTHYIDPFGLTGKTRSRFNPMRGFNPDNMEAASKALAGAFIIPGEQETSHWVLSALSLIHI